MTATAPNYRILLVDDHPVFREGLRAIFDEQAGFEVAAEASSLREALEKFQQCHPDLVVTDLRLGQDSGQELVRRILAIRPETLIVAVSMLTDTQEVLDAIEAGAKGYITKGASRREILAALQEVVSGRSYLHPEVAHVLFEKVRQPAAPVDELDLTGRERETLEGICRGLTPHQVGEELHLSVSTVKTYLRSLYRKLDVTSRTQLVLKAMERKLVSALNHPNREKNSST